MALPVTVPRLGWSMEEGNFVEWFKHDGDAVKPGDALFVLESDKAAETVEALDAGILRIAPGGPGPGDRVRVGQILAHLVAEGEAVPETGAPPPPAPVKGQGTVPPPAGPAARQLARDLGVNLAAVAGSELGGRVTEADVLRHAPAYAPASRSKPASSPRARRVAKELGIDWANVTGSGRGGRVRERDVRAVAGTAEGRLLPHTGRRRTIAARMVAAVTQAAPVTLTTRADATNLVSLRSQFKAAAGSPEDIVPSYSDLILKLTAAALRRHPLLQAQWRDDGLFVPDRVDIALAVDTEAGLLAPVLRGVDGLTLREVAARSRELADRARAGRLTADEMRGGTFTVTNLGMFGVEFFTPLLQLPQSAVLGVGRIAREPAVVGDRVEPRDVLALSLTFDHRVTDGAPAARFLDALRRAIEQPAPWLVP